MNRDKDILLEKLRKKNAFWSYDNVKAPDDASLVEHVLLSLDISEIDQLFRIYEKEFIRSIWEERLLAQEPYYHGLNRFYAWFYFGIDDPDDFFRKRKLYAGS
jgi:hypothetical protein